MAMIDIYRSNLQRKREEYAALSQKKAQLSSKIAMVIDAETLKKTLQSYVIDVKKTMPVERVFLFGSYANGSPDEWSDVDVCFFFERFDGKDSIDAGMKLLDAAYKYLPEIVIEPHSFLTKELENDNPFVKEILRTGREIKVDD